MIPDRSKPCRLPPGKRTQQLLLRYSNALTLTLRASPPQIKAAESSGNPQLSRDIHPLLQLGQAKAKVIDKQQPRFFPFNFEEFRSR
jgi:hypothetical protein